MTFMSDRKRLGAILDQVHEMMYLTESDTVPSFGFSPIREHLTEIRPDGAVIKIEGLKALKELLEKVHEAKQWLRESDEESDIQDPTPGLRRLVDQLDALPDLRRRIHNLMDDEGEIKDTASRILRAIRQEMRSLSGSISRTMQSILRSAQENGWVDRDAQATVREGRLLLPIHPAAKREVPGIIHDESATGKTLFVEPEQLVETNNKIREKQSEEKREITRLLKEITSHIRTQIAPIQDNCTVMGILDLAFAKSRLANAQNAIVPILAPEGDGMEWFSARHPLLEKHLKSQDKEIVPLDITLDRQNRILVISGPNAGGKSVALKTVGLLQFMLQCGLPIPLADHSRCCIFESIFMDMGDDQSYENDLSTYSSHLLSMKFICKHADPDTLILIDEFGSGTEPIIGGAIAEAVLNRLVDTGCMGLINTHYGNLKEYCENHDGVINGAMLFDRQKIQPLYKLFIGQAGSSFAVEIARKIGLPQDILSYAEELVGTDYVMQDKYLQDILRDKKYWEEKRYLIRKKEKELDRRNSELSEKIEKLKRERADRIAKAEEEALRILSSANASVENTIRQIKESEAEKEATKKARERLEEKRSDLRTKVEKKQHKRGTNKLTAADKPIEVGSFVTIQGSNEVGEVLSLERKKAKVRMGSIVIEVPLSRLKHSLRKASSVQKSKPKGIEVQENSRRLNFQPRLDIRGKRADEALQELIYFIDDAVRYGYSPVRILHGTGTGALRQAVREHLRTNSAVRQVEDEKPDLGGAGITVVYLH